MKKEKLNSFEYFFIAFVICLLLWFVHIGYCFATGEWGFMIAGALVFPIAVIHGCIIVCGWFLTLLWWIVSLILL